jgi:GT2 family glycosyltransferase
MDAGLQQPRVVVLILMYGHPDDAIEAVSSVLASDYPDFRVILLDNASPDGAYGAVKAWANGERAPPIAAPLPGIAPPRRGPIDYAEHRPEDRPNIASLPPLTLVETGANLGYAGGNNVALRWLMESQDWDYAWILNPDAAVDPAAMSALVRRAQADPAIGLVGSRLLSYESPETVQCRAGGKYMRAAGRCRVNGFGLPAAQPDDRDSVERAIDYVSGASLFVSKDFLHQTGPMEESYFLYYEEVDWAFRRGPFKLAYAPDALVYHKHGASIGSSYDKKKISPVALYWSYRNRFVFTRKFVPWALPMVFASAGLDMTRMALSGHFMQARQALLVVLGLARPPGQRRGGN